MRFLFPFVALSMLTVGAANAEPIQFKREGATFSYETKKDGNTQVIYGRNLSTNDAFTLRVHENYVTGTFGGSRVSFPLTKAQAEQLAAR